jgi:Ni/Co efflux regulator RcnB
MRSLSFLILLATVATPALAQDDRGSRRQRGASAEQSESREQRATEPRRSEAREQRAPESRRSETREQRQFGGERSERSQASQQGTTERIREHVLEQRLQRQQAASIPSGDADNVRVRRRESDAVSGGSTPTNWRARERRVRTIPDTQPTATPPSTTQRDAFQGRNRRDYRDGNYNRWTRDWHRDRRYDWRRHRDRHRSIFRIGFYSDPFGWNYRRWSIGSYLYPSYFRSSFWLNDPWQYRLPPAYGPYRWVRYWNDALLVNTYTGEVVDVIHGFFW